jgi:hypothetical protein
VTRVLPRPSDSAPRLAFEPRLVVLGLLLMIALWSGEQARRKARS